MLCLYNVYYITDVNYMYITQKNKTSQSVIVCIVPIKDKFKFKNLFSFFLAWTVKFTCEVWCLTLCMLLHWFVGTNAFLTAGTQKYLQ